MNSSIAPVAEATTFASLGLTPGLVQATSAAGYTTPTPIQCAAIPAAIAGRDVLGLAQTGTGKTAAFVLPILQRFSTGPKPTGRGKIRALVLSPTRELAAQIEDQVVRYGNNLGIRSTVIFGGVGQGRQVDALRRGIDLLVATPGRLEDLMQQRLIDLSGVEVLVLDEADRMLDVGFLPAVRRLAKVLPTNRQTLFFSATMPPELESLSASLLRDPVRAQVAASGTAVAKVEQALYHVSTDDKKNLLCHVITAKAIQCAVVFTRTKRGADRVAKHLAANRINAEAIHGNKSQNARERALDGFRDGQVRVLVATDLASRGLDVEGITHVINFDMPMEPESYVHRIGRTARAGKDGAAMSFCAPDERDRLRDIERLLKARIPVVDAHPFVQGAHFRTSAPAPSRPSVQNTRQPTARQPMAAPLNRSGLRPPPPAGGPVTHSAPPNRTGLPGERFGVRGTTSSSPSARA